MLSLAPLWIVGRSSLPAKDLKELIAWLKANPDKASAATTGLGSGIHLCLVYFQNTTGTKFPARALSRRRAADAGSDRPGRSICHVRRRGRRCRNTRSRQYQGLCGA